MRRLWAVFKAHPYVGNVLGYTALFASADLIQQSLLTSTTEDSRVRGEKADGDEKTSGIDWHQTARVATVGFCFHANFNYHWLKALEKALPGGGAKMVSGKVVLDQLIAAPLTISAFYTGLSFLENKEDLLEEWSQKFWPSYKAGVVYWSTMQAINFSLVPPVARTVFLGGIALTFTIFLCHMKRQGKQSQ
ncbi:mpv17-like protein [Eucyclogobius newberryi]|uniref:mpv17-like protein n=1 Tax=Eucyclogobius newberryi TaxID=166745 RepID=UPI003B5BE6EE